MYFLGIDIDTKQTKAIILDTTNGQIISESTVNHNYIEGLPQGHSEQDPVEWIRAVETTLYTCIEKLSDSDRKKIAGLGVSGQQHGLVVLDSEDRVIRPSKLENDISADSQADEINQAFGGAPGLIEMTGNPCRPHDCAAKLLWLKQHEPFHFQRIKRALLPHDFINYWLTGVSRTDFGDASATGLFDVKNRKWSTELLDYIDPDLKNIITPAASSRKAHGTLRDDLSQKWGLPEGITVAAGSGHHMMKAIAAGTVSPGTITIELNSAAALYGVSETALIDPRAEITALCDANDRYLSLFQLNNALSTTRTIQRHYGISDENFEAIVHSAQPGCEGILMLPYLKKEIAPKLPEASGSWHGISPANFTPANMMRASVESVALGLTYGLQRMIELGIAPTNARLIGAGAESPLWRQLLADALGLPLTTATEQVEPAVGAAISAAHLNQLKGDSKASLSQLTDTLIPTDPAQNQPNKRLHEHYLSQHNRQQYLVETLHGAGFL